MDQNGCAAARVLYTSGTDKRKNDLLFFHGDGLLYLPIQSKVGSYITNLGLTNRRMRFFVRDKWYNLSDYREPVPTTGIDELARRNTSWKGGSLMDFCQALLYDQHGCPASIVTLFKNS